MKSSTITYLLFLCVLIIAGCATTQDDARMKTLSRTTDNYRNAIRWGLYEVADNLRSADADIDRSYIDQLKKIKVTAYRSIQRNVSDDGTEATDVIEIKYYNIDFMVEKTLINKQLWKYDPDKKTWRLKSRLPEFK